MNGRFLQIINSGKPVLVDFYADWCGPCKMMPPILKELKDEFRENIRIIKVNVDRNPKIASHYNIKSIPTLLLFQNGQIMWQTMGVQPTHVIRNKIKSIV